ncbi:MAG: glycerate kinase [Eggerthellaceae bacterium]|nr:glycerate kinase [Eggerthellaceae bacterium]
MKKIVLIPDSFKGTLSSTQICEILSTEIKKQFSDCEIISIPVADGGEGSVDCFLSALGGEKIIAIASGPHLEKMEAYFGYLPESSTAVIEMASCAGLPLVENHKDPLGTTTYGVGELLLEAANHGATKIILGLGGSCTTDGGCGAAAACGVKFYDKTGNSFIPTGGTLSQIEHIDTSGLNPAIKMLDIVAMCDIENPMYGPEGAAYVFGPQKGASENEVKLLDEGLMHLANVIKKNLRADVAAVPGTGAAGAMGAGMIAFFGAQLQMGIETVLDTVHFSEIVKDADLAITGEGKLDGQSLRGKVVIGVAKRAQDAGIPVIALVGGVESDISDAYKKGVTAIFPINRLPEDFSISKEKSAENLAATAQDVLRLVRFIEKREAAEAKTSATPFCEQQ